MDRLSIENAILVFVRQSAFVPLFHKDKEQRGQHGRRLRAGAALIALL